MAKQVQLMGMRTNCVTCEFSDILDEDTEAELKEAVQISMGTEVSEDDITNIQALCDQVRTPKRTPSSYLLSLQVLEGP